VQIAAMLVLRRLAKHTSASYGQSILNGWKTANNEKSLGGSIDAKTRQAILRHADVSVTEKHYVKPVAEVSAAAMAKFQGVLEAKQKARAAQKRKGHGQSTSREK
jgi:hypothetical protein